MSDEELAKYRVIAGTAGSVPSAGPHLDAPTLARVQSGADDTGLDEAYRHLSTCAVCRARIVEDHADVARVRTNVTSLAPKRARWLAPLLVAAVVAAAAVTVVRSGRPNLPAEVSLVQRSYVATMGSGSVSSVASDRNLELSFEAPAGLEGALVLFDGAQRVEPVRWFERDGRTLRLALAPRLLPPGTREALLYIGSHAAVERALATTDVAIAGRAGVRVQRVVLGP